MYNYVKTLAKSKWEESKRGKITMGVRAGRLVGTLLFLILAGSGIFVLFQSPLFAVQNIVVKGNRILSAEEIMALSGINVGENIFRLRLQEAAARIAVNPRVKEVKISRRLPATVEINLRERESRALVMTEKGVITIDEEGVVLGPGNLTDDLPLFTGLLIREVEAGEKLGAEGLTDLLAVQAVLPPTIRKQVHELHREKDGRVVLLLIGGLEVKLGSTENLPAKMKVLEGASKLWQEEKGRIAYVDLSVPAAPVVKYR